MTEAKLVSNVFGTFSFLFLFGLLAQVLRVWKAAGTFPVARAWPGVAAFTLPVLMFGYAMAPGLFGPQFAALWNWPARLAGLALLCLGTAVVAVAMHTMGGAWRMGIDPEQRARMVSEGIYARVRHPIYGGVIVICLGMFLLAANAFFLGVFLAAWLGMTLQARAEERFLDATFGESYREYVRRTGRFLPRL